MAMQNNFYPLVALNFIIILASGKEMIKTTSSEDYTFAAVPAGMSRLTFKVKTDDAAHVSLSAGEDQESANMYEIFLGEAKNTKTFIRRERNKPGGGRKVEQSVAATPQILSSTEWRSFWLSWSAGGVQLGREGEVSALLEFKDIDPIKVTHYGCRTKWLTGDWDFEFEALASTAPASSSSNQTKRVSQMNPLKASRDYKFIPVTSSSLLLSLKVGQDVYVLLSGSTEQDVPPFYEIRLGKNKNKKSAISCDRSKDQDNKIIDVEDKETPGLLSTVETRGFWITWGRAGSIRVGKQGEVDSFINMTNPEPFPVKFCGIRIGSGVAEWQLQESNQGTPFNATSDLEEISSILDSLGKLIINHVSTDPTFKNLKTPLLSTINDDEVLSENAEFAERLIKVVGEMRQLFTLECKKNELLEKDTEDDMKQLLKTVDGLLKYLYGDSEIQECTSLDTKTNNLTEELLQTVDQIFKYFYDDPLSAVASVSATVPVNVNLVKTIMNNSAIIDNNLVKALVVTITPKVLSSDTSAKSTKTVTKVAVKKTNKDDEDDEDDD